MLRKLACAVALILGAAAPVASQQTDAELIVVYVARHAERAEDGTDDDPPISVEGEARAELLAAMLRDARLTHVHTTDTRRTRATATPTAIHHGITPTLYGAGDLDALAALIRRTPGRHLVVGHTNTVRETVTALGGEPGGPIDPDEYDRLYVLTLARGETGTVFLRFGSAIPTTPR